MPIISQRNTFTVNKMEIASERGNKANKLPQYVAALSVTLGAVAAGTVLGWTANTADDLKGSKLNDIEISQNALSWMSSASTLGAMCVCFPIGYLCDLIGRKWACLSTVVVFSIGWLLIILSSNVAMLYAGRFLTGIAGGAFCVAAPIYTSEIAETEIRGTLGSYFQVMLTVGILFAYVIGAYMSVKWLSILSALIPLAFGVIFFFQPETPVYLLKKGRKHEALKSLQKLRGAHYNCDNEIKDIQAQLDKEASLQTPFFVSLRSTAAKKAVMICFGLMFFQQLSGVNAVIFYTGTIFKSTGGSIDPAIATIGVGVVQSIATFVSSLVVDKFGRKILLMLSDLSMAISGCLLGIYFTLNDRDVISKDAISSISWLPILSLVIFIATFSLGFGPIPWMISAEMMPAEIKSVACSAAATFNWFLAFVVTYSYNGLVDAMGSGDGTFYIFTGISILGTIFVMLCVPETKGKTLQEVQDILSGNSRKSNSHSDHPQHTKQGIDNATFTK